MESELKLDILKHRTGQSSGHSPDPDSEKFRESISTVDEKGKRVWIYPKKPSGNYHKARVAVTTFLLALLFAGPFITIGGQPLLLLNVFERRFIVLVRRSGPRILSSWPLR